MRPAHNPLLIFVSSVQQPKVDDLSAERVGVIEEIRRLELTRDWAFEETPASSDSTDESYMQFVDACDIFVIIVGHDLTQPVEREWHRATEMGKPRLVFIRRGEEMTPRAGAWLRDVDVKYDRFSSAEDLQHRVRAALIDEIVKGYRRYQIQRQDYEKLAETIRSSAISFVVRTIQPSELEVVSSEFPQLAELNPNLEDWIEKKRLEIVHGDAEAFVSAYEGHNAGFAVTSEKGDRVRKLSTLYMLPDYQGLGVGPRLLYDVLLKASQDGCEKMYVTVSEERRPDLEPLLRHYGFFVEGVSGRRYRRDSWEWIWGKRLLSGVLALKDLPAFVRRVVFSERGFEIREIGERAFLARRLVNGLGLAHPPLPPVLCYIGSDPSTTSEDYAVARELSRWLAVQLVFVGSNRPALVEDSDLVYDAYDLETAFFPLFLDRPCTGLVLSIREIFARQLIPSSQQPQFFAPTRTQLRTDNVYYRTANQFNDLARGSPLFFYETSRTAKDSQLIGEAKLEEWRVEEPRELFAAYGNLGVYTLDDLETTAKSAQGAMKGKALGLKFDWYREFAHALGLAKVKAIMPKYNPTTARRIDIHTAIELRKAAGWNVTELSYQ